jgi:hypothetical protein
MALIPENIQASLVLSGIKLIPIAYSDQNVAERIDSSIRFSKVNFCPTDVIINFSPSIIRAKCMDSNLIEIKYDTELYEVPNCPESFTISNNSIVEVSM